jgi:hypothetical protein
VDAPSPDGVMTLAQLGAEPEPVAVTVIGIVSIVDERKMHIILFDDALIGKGLDDSFRIVAMQTSMIKSTVAKTQATATVTVTVTGLGSGRRGQSP